MWNRIAALAMACGAGLLIAGCQPGREALRDCSIVRRHGPITVGLKLPRHEFRRGDEFTVKVVTVNTSDEALTLRRYGEPKYFIQIARNEGLGWETVKTYPTGAADLLREWSIPAGHADVYQTTLIVEPDWPTGETLRISAEMNRHPEVRVADFIRVEREP